MHTDDYFCHQDDDDQPAADLAAYDLYVIEQRRKSDLLLTHHGALTLARAVAEDLAGLVHAHALPDGHTTLGKLLAETVAEAVIEVAMEGSKGLPRQPISREGFIAIRKTLNAACLAFEALLAAEAAR